MEKRCICCRDKFFPRNRTQIYCSKKSCQLERKNRWQKEKMSKDASYYESQIDAVRLWRVKNPDYMKEYRKKHPEYTDHNRQQQRQRRKESAAPLTRPDPGVVKMDARTRRNAVFPIKAGTYTLIPSSVVKMDAMVVQLTVLERVT